MQPCGPGLSLLILLILSGIPEDSQYYPTHCLTQFDLSVA